MPSVSPPAGAGHPRQSSATLCSAIQSPNGPERAGAQRAERRVDESRPVARAACRPATGTARRGRSSRRTARRRRSRRPLPLAALRPAGRRAQQRPRVPGAGGVRDRRQLGGEALVEVEVGEEREEPDAVEPHGRPLPVRPRDHSAERLGVERVRDGGRVGGEVACRRAARARPRSTAAAPREAPGARFAMKPAGAIRAHRPSRAGCARRGRGARARTPARASSRTSRPRARPSGRRAPCAPPRDPRRGRASRRSRGSRPSDRARTPRSRPGRRVERKPGSESGPSRRCRGCRTRRACSRGASAAEVGLLELEARG